MAIGTEVRGNRVFDTDLFTGFLGPASVSAPSVDVSMTYTTSCMFPLGLESGFQSQDETLTFHSGPSEKCLAVRWDKPAYGRG